MRDDEIKGWIVNENTGKSYRVFKCGFGYCEETIYAQLTLPDASEIGRPELDGPKSIYHLTWISFDSKPNHIDEYVSFKTVVFCVDSRSTCIFRILDNLEVIELLEDVKCQTG